MKKRSRFAFLVLCFTALAASAPALAEVKVGVCDTMLILRESEEGKRRLASYQMLEDKKKKELQGIEDEVNRLQDQIKQVGPSIREAKRTELERKLEDMIIDGTRRKKDAERELALMLDDIQQEMGKLVIPIIQEVGADLGYAMIFNLQQGGLLYYDEAIDVTYEVIKRFNARVQKGE